MQDAVMILAAWNDPHASTVNWALRSNNVPTLIAPDVSGLASRTSIVADAQHMAWRLDVRDVVDGAIRSVWFRRPKPVRATHCLESDRAFVEQEWQLFQRNVFDLEEVIVDAQWVNSPARAAAAESKLMQLRAAQQLGIPFPDIAVTNDVREVRAMVERWGRIVHKVFSPHIWKSASDQSYHSVAVTLIDADTPLLEDSIALCPSLFQRYVDKAYDVRVTVIGDRLFPVRIGKRTGEAYLDPRQHMLDDEIEMVPLSLSPAWEQKLRALMKRLGLVFGCIDLVADRKGHLYFLEINQAGQFLFVEDKLPALPLLRAMTAFLMTGRTDYDLEDSIPVHLEQFRDSSEYERVNESHRDTKWETALEE